MTAVTAFKTGMLEQRTLNKAKMLNSVMVSCKVLSCTVLNALRHYFVWLVAYMCVYFTHVVCVRKKY